MTYEISIDEERVRVFDDGTFQVASRSRRDEWHDVIPAGKPSGPRCSMFCEGFAYRGACRHLDVVSRLKAVEAPLPRIRPAGQIAEPWVNWRDIVGFDKLPVASAHVISAAIAKMVRTGDVSPTAPWLALEYWASEYLAGPE